MRRRFQVHLRRRFRSLCSRARRGRKPCLSRRLSTGRQVLHAAWWEGVVAMRGFVASFLRPRAVPPAAARCSLALLAAGTGRRRTGASACLRLAWLVLFWACSCWRTRVGTGRRRARLGAAGLSSAIGGWGAPRTRAGVRRRRPARTSARMRAPNAGWCAFPVDALRCTPATVGPQALLRLFSPLSNLSRLRSPFRPSERPSSRASRLRRCPASTKVLRRPRPAARRRPAAFPPSWPGPSRPRPPAARSRCL